MLHSRARLVVLALLGWATVGWAAGPRWVTGPPFFTTTGQPVIWYTNAPLYFTDPGDLSATVNHAAADALVAAAAAIWNVPTSQLVLAQGTQDRGLLAEHVSGANAYAGSGGIVFPTDVQAANYQAKQIAVIYDRDGSVTDLLLGVGGSDPSGCRQSAVTESVDSIVPAGSIQHAVLILNGRCTGTAPEMQLQMQYQLMRAFGRVLGLGWSQTNDNVFTGSPVASYQQALHWPVMHPIDVICGTYIYQCMPLPFTLRADDLSGLALLYPIAQGQAGPGQTDTLLNASRIGGVIRFPNGQSMQGVNVTGRRLSWFRPDSDTELWQSVSSVSGFRFRRLNPNAVAGTDTSLSGSMGSYGAGDEGWYEFTRMPMLPGGWQKVLIETEPINPMYVGPYSVGPYTSGTVLPSGNSPEDLAGLFGSYADYGWFDYVLGGGAATCASPVGSEASPQNVATEGWWTGQMCGYGQAIWLGMPIKANRSLTLEVTAQDEQGFATIAKAMPVIGVWRATDALDSTPALAALKAFNRVSAGLTALTVQGMGATTLRIGIADERGDGRPDFNLGGRVLYADSVTPANIGAGGGIVTILGQGFRAGNVVTVDGVAAVVQSWTSTTIVATVPASKKLVAGITAALVADVTVSDVSTRGTTVMTGALTYAAPLPEVMRLVSAPASPATAGNVATTAFAVRVFDSDGITPVAGESVVLSASGAGVEFGACRAATCTVITDAMGTASSPVTALAAGSIVLTAVGISSRISASFTAVDPPDQVTLVSTPAGVVFVGDLAGIAFEVRVTRGDGVTPVAGAAVVFAASGAAVRFGACGAATCSVMTDASGLASTTVTLLGAGTIVISATAAAGTVTAFLTSVIRIRTITPTRLVEYVAEGATVIWSPQISLTDNSAAVMGVGVVWTVSSRAMSLESGASTTDLSGAASVVATVGPVVAGAQAVGSACAWGTVCAGFAAQGVGAADLRVEVLSGADQAVAPDATLGILVVRITDGAGHGVAGVVVEAYQTVEAGVACAGQGRCPAQAVLDRGQSEAVSDVDGMVSISPLQRAGEAEVTNIVVTAGTQGFVSLTLTKGW